MFKPTTEQEAILGSHKTLYSFTIVKGAEEYTRCSLVDSVSGKPYVEGKGTNDEAAFNDAIVKIETAIKPFATEDAARIANLQKEIEDLKAKLASPEPKQPGNKAKISRPAPGTEDNDGI